jgi:tryptophanyl-tRNA synthetase
MKPAVELQAEGEGFYFIADYHAMTSGRDAAALRENVRELAIDFLACGLDPEKSVFFRQSAVPEVNELAWILSTVCPMPLLNKCHSYKDKVAQGISPNHALFAYPVLMAADILLYDSNKVPVGKDQKQHLEVTRDIAIKMNETFGPVFKLPEPSIREDAALVPGTDGAKMSKSYGNTIEIFADEKAMKKKIMGIVTDSTPVEEPKDAEASSIYQLYKLFAAPEQAAAMAERFRAGGTGYGDFKKELFATVWEYFAPMRARRAELEADRAHVDEVLRRGAEHANKLAATVMARVETAVGLRG